MQPFQLPSSRYPVYQASGHSRTGDALPGEIIAEGDDTVSDSSRFNQETRPSSEDDNDDDLTESKQTPDLDIQSSRAHEVDFAPKTMREYAEQLDAT